MALNCPIMPNGVPNQVEGEYYILFRDHMEFEVRMDGVGKRTATGRVYLTTLRMVFVNDKRDSSDFKSFDIPIKFMFNYKVEMPIFGSTSFQGSVKPLFNLLPGDSHFKMWFKKGKCDTFIRYLSNILEDFKRYGVQQQQQSQFITDLRSGNFNHKAMIDPQDPTTIYYGQPI